MQVVSVVKMYVKVVPEMEEKFAKTALSPSFKSEKKS